MPLSHAARSLIKSLLCCTDISSSNSLYIYIFYFSSFCYVLHFKLLPQVCRYKFPKVFTLFRKKRVCTNRAFKVRKKLSFPDSQSEPMLSLRQSTAGIPMRAPQACSGWESQVLHRFLSCPLHECYIDFYDVPKIKVINQAKLFKTPFELTSIKYVFVALRLHTYVSSQIGCIFLDSNCRNPKCLTTLCGLT
jgi:hypothetical protein